MPKNKPDREAQIRKEISELVRELYGMREGRRTFTPGKDRVNYAGRVYGHEEIDALVQSALDFWLTLGPEGAQFVKRFARAAGRRHAVLVNSGSSANLLAMTALTSHELERPLKPGDQVLTTALTFPTTLAPILQNGLVPVFVDVEPDTYAMDTARAARAMTRKTRAVFLAHTLGNVCDMPALCRAAAEKEMYVIEDVCDALGSTFKRKRAGTFGHLSTYSFYAAHHITLGEGGAVATDDTALFRIVTSLRDWGRACYCQTGEKHPMGACRKRFAHSFPDLPPGYDHKYTYTHIGYNLKPLDLQAAIGLVQLERLAEFTRLRKKNFKTIAGFLKPYQDLFVLPRAAAGAQPSWFAFPITVKKNPWFTRDDLVAHLEEQKIETRMLFAGNILRHPGFRDIPKKVVGSLRHTDNIMANAFFIGVYPGLDSARLEYMKQAFEDFIHSRRKG